MDKKNRRVDRSSFLKTSFDGIAATGLVPGCANPPANDATPSAQEQLPAIALFTRQEFSTLQALAERVFPKSETSPGSTDLGVAQYIDRRMNGACDWGARMYKQRPWSIRPTTGHGWQAAQRVNGGAIIGSDPHTSVVNRWLQMWDYDNVFVVGASAFPQKAGFNPTGTVGGLAFRDADALVNRWFCKPEPLA